MIAEGLAQLARANNVQNNFFPTGTGLNPMKQLRACIFNDFLYSQVLVNTCMLCDTFVLVFTRRYYKDCVQDKKACKNKQICTSELSSQFFLPGCPTFIENSTERSQLW